MTESPLLLSPCHSRDVYTSIADEQGGRNKGGGKRDRKTESLKS